MGRVTQFEVNSQNGKCTNKRPEDSRDNKNQVLKASFRTKLFVEFQVRGVCWVS